MSEALAETAGWTAAVRARESARPDRLFTDRLASALAGSWIAHGLPADALTDLLAGHPFLPIRTRFFDDWLTRATVTDGLRQVVLPAAGMDARAFRLRWPADVVLWELDQPTLLADKAAILTGRGVVPGCRRRTAGVDLTGSTWPAALRAAGFDPRRPSVWLAEGFLTYLAAGRVARFLDAVAGVAAPGSQLGFDVPAADLLTAPGMADFLRGFARRGTPWRFGTNEPEELLARHGWRAVVVTQPGQPDAHYGRWPWPATPRTVPGTFFVIAARQP